MNNTRSVIGRFTNSLDLKSYIGKIYYNWTVIGIPNPNKKRHPKLICKCVCGTEKGVDLGNLKNGKAKGCGCGIPKMEDLTGLTFGFWTVLRFYGKNPKNNKDKIWWCKCVCGIEKRVYASQLKKRNSVPPSCGCMSLEIRKIFHSRHRKKKISWDSYRCNTKEDRKRYADWKRAVYQICGKRCCICKSEESLVCHHLDGWHWCIDRRYDPTNGEVCCWKHHEQFHALFGRRNNTKEQFIKFKINILNSDTVLLEEEEDDEA